MLLFDDGERSYTGYRVPQESSFAFLNRSGQPKFERTRILLENWFQKYPAAHQVALGTGFRSNEDTQHWGAFFELYCPRDAQREEESEEDGLSCGVKKLCSR
jgi:hypothetical protein